MELIEEYLDIFEGGKKSPNNIIEGRLLSNFYTEDGDDNWNKEMVDGEIVYTNVRWGNDDYILIGNHCHITFNGNLGYYKLTSMFVEPEHRGKGYLLELIKNTINPNADIFDEYKTLDMNRQGIIVPWIDNKYDTIRTIIVESEAFSFGHLDYNSAHLDYHNEKNKIVKDWIYKCYTDINSREAEIVSQNTTNIINNLHNVEAGIKKYSLFPNGEIMVDIFGDGVDPFEYLMYFHKVVKSANPSKRLGGHSFTDYDEDTIKDVVRQVDKCYMHHLNQFYKRLKKKQQFVVDSHPEFLI